MNWLTPAYAFLAALTWGLCIRIGKLDRRSSLNRTLMAGLAVCGVWLMGSALAIAAPDPGLFWIFLRIAAVAFYLGSVPGVLVLLDFAGFSRPWRFVLILPTLVLGLVQASQALYGPWTITGYHPTAWGNVSIYNPDPALVEISSLWSIVNAAVGLTALGWAWFHSRSRRYRAIAIQILLLSVAANLFGLWSTLVVWQTWNLPDPTGLSVAGLVGVYSYLITRYKHLSEQNPDLTDPLLANLSGTVLFANRHGRITVVPEQAKQLLGSAADGADLAEVLKGCPTVQAEWNTLAATLQPRTGLPGTFGSGKFLVHLIPHRNPFHEFDGALVRIVPEGPFDTNLVRFGVSPREKEVAVLACEGLDTRQIAEALFISQATVKNHLHSLYTKTGTAGRADLVRVLLSEAPGQIG